jgi:hypothetical protein
MRRGQGLYGGVGMAEGLGFNPQSKRNPGRSWSACHVHPGLLGRDDRWGHSVGEREGSDAWDRAVSEGKRGWHTLLGESPQVGRGLLRPLGQFGSPRPFSLFFLPDFLFFPFSGFHYYLLKQL